MKKFFTLSIFLFTLGCINPSMENGFAKLIESLKQLTASFEAINVPQIKTDLESMVVDLTIMAEDIEIYNESIIEYNNAIILYSDAMEALNLAFAEYAMTMEEYQTAVDELTDSLNGIALLSTDFYEAFSALQTM